MQELALQSHEPLDSQLATLAEAAGRRLGPGPVWLRVYDGRMPRLEHGWKIHVSARPATLHAAVERALPVLLAAVCDFKVVASRDVLRDMNSAQNRPGSVGKALAVYPRPDVAVHLAAQLAEALVGLDGPRIRSDLRLRPDAPVYYRYGPFRARFRCLENGDVAPALFGPAGQVFPGEAGGSYRCPDWVDDPFPKPDPRESTLPRSSLSAHRLLGGRYRLVDGVLRSARGGVYRAVDSVTGKSVVVKQACAWVGEDVTGADVRANLRLERTALQALDGLTCVPHLLDHFRHGEDEFLVTVSVGDTDLRRDVIDSGPYPWTGGPRSVQALGEELLAHLDAVHARGVVLRDLAPKNVVLGADGRRHLVDFDIASVGGAHRRGYTPGYAPPAEQRESPQPDHDYYALGATLLYAATGLDPVRMPDDPERSARRSLAVLSAARPDAGPLGHLLAGLLSTDSRRRAEAAAGLRAGTAPRVRTLPHGDADALPDLPTVDADLLTSIVRRTVDVCLQQAAELCRRNDQPTPVNVYLGSAGLLLELLHHGSDAAWRSGVEDLADHLAGSVGAVDFPPGLLFGTTGTALALIAAGYVLEEDRWLRAGQRLAATERARLHLVRRDDLVGGLAGVGLGHLLLARTSGERHLELASECARRLLPAVCGPGVSGVSGVPTPRTPSTPTAGLRWGLAHGLAGVAYFLAAYAAATGDPAAGSAAHRMYDELAAEVPRLLDAAGGLGARPMSASWCQGLAGIGSSLLEGAGLLGDHGHITLVRATAEACVAVAPRMSVVSQCCGLAGVGEFLLDLETRTGESRYADQARHVLSLMLSRCGGSDEQPDFPDHSLLRSSGQWAVGSPGVLSFLRRLSRGPAPRLLSADWEPRVVAAADHCAPGGSR